MSKFKVGDRVVAYYDYRSKGVRGEVVEIDPLGSGLLHIKRDTGSDRSHLWLAHPKQCCKLKKKAPKIRQFAAVYHDDKIGSTYNRKDEAEYAGFPDALQIVELVEVKRYAARKA